MSFLTRIVHQKRKIQPKLQIHYLYFSRICVILFMLKQKQKKNRANPIISTQSISNTYFHCNYCSQNFISIPFCGERRWNLSRYPRNFAYSQIYHVILKGIDGHDIFYDNNDKDFFLKQLLKTKQNFNLAIYSYCLMSNHVHLVIKCPNELLS